MIALGRKNALFAGSDRGGTRAIIASLVGTCRLTEVNPYVYLTDVLERLVGGHLQSRIDDAHAMELPPRSGRVVGTSLTMVEAIYPLEFETAEDVLVQLPAFIEKTMPSVFAHRVAT